MTFRVFKISGLWLFLFLSGCFSDSVDITPSKITISIPNENKTKFSDFFTFSGFTKLQDAGSQPLRSITKVLFAENSIIVLDAETDFKDIYRYDANSGNFLNKIGYQSEQAGGYNELYDIDLNADNNQVIGFSTGNTSLVMYDFMGNLLKQLRVGVLGDGIAALPDGGYVVYSEYSATPISGYHFLVFYDDRGNVVKRAFPYPASLDNSGYDYTGFLCRTGKDIVFSPPFSDTIYAIYNRKIVPIQILDFQAKAMPKHLRLKKLEGDEINNKSFLNEGVVKSKNLTLFHFTEEYGSSLGIYDDIQKRFMNATYFDRKDPLNEIIQVGNIFPKGNDQFALVLEPKRVRYLIENNLLVPSDLAKTYPELARAIEESATKSNYILLYFEAK